MRLRHKLEGSPLTRREREVICYAAIGCTDPEIAHIMGISAQTIKNHMCSIRIKLQARNRTHAVAIMMRSFIEQEYSCQRR